MPDIYCCAINISIQNTGARFCGPMVPCILFLEIPRVFLVAGGRLLPLLLSEAQIEINIYTRMAYARAELAQCFN